MSIVMENELQSNNHLFSMTYWLRNINGVRYILKHTVAAGSDCSANLGIANAMVFMKCV